MASVMNISGGMMSGAHLSNVRMWRKNDIHQYQCCGMTRRDQNGGMCVKQRAAGISSDLALL